MRIGNEPKVSKILDKTSLFHMPTPGMRQAPELLAQELMQIFFNESLFAQKGGVARELDPVDFSSDIAKHAVYSFAGRKKKGDKNYYSPPYPQFVKNLLIRGSDRSSISAFLIEGPISTYFSQYKDFTVAEKEITSYVDQVAEALLGDTRHTVPAEIYAKATIEISLDDEDRNISEIDDRNRNNKKAIVETILRKSQDPKMRCEFEESNRIPPISIKITQDLLALCQLEPSVPRHHWVTMLMAFLRLSVSTWAVYVANSITQVAEWVKKSLEGVEISQREIDDYYLYRYETLIPSNNTNNSVEDISTKFMKSRIFLNIFLDSISDKLVSYEYLTTKPNDSHSKSLSLVELLKITRKESIQVESNPSLLEFNIVKKCTYWPNYLNPLKSGQGKNLLEMLNMLKKYDDTSEQSSHLLEPVFIGHRKYFKTKPGNLIIQLGVYLADYQRLKLGKEAVASSLTLGALEEHFSCYGLSFSSSPDGRQLLIDILSMNGLLVSSPDAGENSKLNNPYRMNKL